MDTQMLFFISIIVGGIPVGVIAVLTAAGLKILHRIDGDSCASLENEISTDE